MKAALLLSLAIGGLALTSQIIPEHTQGEYLDMAINEAVKGICQRERAAFFAISAQIEEENNKTHDMGIRVATLVHQLAESRDMYTEGSDEIKRAINETIVAFGREYRLFWSTYAESHTSTCLAAIGETPELPEPFKNIPRLCMVQRLNKASKDIMNILNEMSADCVDMSSCDVNKAWTLIKVSNHIASELMTEWQYSDLALHEMWEFSSGNTHEPLREDLAQLYEGYNAYKKSYEASESLVKQFFEWVEQSFYNAAKNIEGDKIEDETEHLRNKLQDMAREGGMSDTVLGSLPENLKPAIIRRMTRTRM